MGLIQFRENSTFSSVSYNFYETLIDPGDNWRVFRYIKNVLLTHAHFDHIYGLNTLANESSDLAIYTNEIGYEMLLDAKKNLSTYHGDSFVFNYPEKINIVIDGEEVDIGHGIYAKAIFTPGHNPSCITWIVEDAIFTGDSYIPGIKTVTNLPGGNKSEAARSEELIKQLAIGRRIFPGHKVDL